MTGLPDGSDATLAPVRESLLATARATVEASADRARELARSLVDAAQLEADRIRVAAVADGEGAARSEALMSSARVRRQAHETVLAARNALRLELEEQVRAAATALRTDPRYPELLARLTERSHSLLGRHATVTESPDGGIVAEAGSRRLDLSLPTLAAETLSQRAAEMDALWTR